MPNEERLKLIIFELQFCNTDRTYQLKLLKEAQDLAVEDYKQKVREEYAKLRAAVDDTYWDDDFKGFETRAGL